MATPIPTNRAAFLLPEIALATQGTITQHGPRGADAAIGVFSDSRAITSGTVFVALRGEAHDGHRFADLAVQKGASVLVVERGALASPPRDVSIVEVDDTLVAWGALARAHLSKWRMNAVDGRVVAITGSAGKTTTKELTRALLSAIAPTHATPGNLNNRIGVPAVIFALESEHRYCVLEMGMSLPGELDAITSIARPDVSVVVNVGVAHAEGVGGREGVMKEKGALYRALGADGTAIVNADDAYVVRAAAEAGSSRVETFGRGSEESRPHYRLVSRMPDPEGGSRVVVAAAGRELSVRLPVPGEAAAIDLLAALAAQESASRERLPEDVVDRALAGVHIEGRGTLRHVQRDILVLDDTYNANPSSMRAALATLAEIAGARRKVVVLGEMKELGPLAEEEHAALGDAVAGAGVALAIGCGGLVDLALERARSLGVKIVQCASTVEAMEVASRDVRPGDAVLVKGSRSTATERVVAALAAIRV